MAAITIYANRLLLLAGFLVLALACWSLDVSEASAAGASPESRNTMLLRAKEAAEGTWIAPADGGWRYKRFTKGRSYTGEAYTQNYPQESWAVFQANMAAGYGYPGNFGGNGQGNDCSGFISSVWLIPRQTTATIIASPYAAKLSAYTKLKRGDALVRRQDGAGHIAMFDRRTGTGVFDVYEQTPPKVVHRQWSWSYAASRGYVPIRRGNIVEETVRPTGKITFPTANSSLYARDSVTIKGDFSDNFGVAEVEFYAKYDANLTDGVSYRKWHLLGVDSRGGNGKYLAKWIVDAPAGQTIDIKAVPYDAAGNAGSQALAQQVTGIHLRKLPSVAVDSPIIVSPEVIGSGMTMSVSYRVKNSSSAFTSLRSVRPEILSPVAAFSAKPVWESSRNVWEGKRAKLAAGDFDGDGKSDVAGLYNRDDAWTSARFISSHETMTSAKTWWDSGPGAANWLDMSQTSGDFNGDGKDDVAFMKDTGNKTAELWVLKSTGKGFVAYRWWDENHLGYWNARNTKITAGDFNGDGKDDIAALYGYGDGQMKSWVFLSAGSAFSKPKGWWGNTAGTFNLSRSRPMAADFNGDGTEDVGILYGAAGGAAKMWVLRSSGSKFSAFNWWQSSSFDPAKVKPVAGDFTGDKRGDVAFFADDGSDAARIWVLRSSAESSRDVFLEPVSWWDQDGSNWFSWKRSSVTAGDTNGDGRSDISVHYDAGYGQARSWQFVSGRWTALPKSQRINLGGNAVSGELTGAVQVAGDGIYQLAVSTLLENGKWRRIPLPANVYASRIEVFKTAVAPGPLVVPRLSTDASASSTLTVSGWKSGAILQPAGARISGFDIAWRSSEDSSWKRWRSRVTASSLVFQASGLGGTYCFKARAWDSRGFVGRYGPSVCGTMPFDDTYKKIWYSGGWTRTSGKSGSLLGTLHVASEKDSKLTMKFQGGAVTWVGAKSPYGGKADVYIDGRFAKRVNLYSSATRKRQQLFSQTWRTAGAHTIKIVVPRQRDNRSKGYKVYIDGLAVR